MTPALAALVPAFYYPRRRDANILDKACRVTGLRRAEVIGASRDRALVRARWATMLAMRAKGVSTPQIGRTLGDRDHTTILYGLERGEALRARDADFAMLCKLVAE